MNAPAEEILAQLRGRMLCEDDIARMLRLERAGDRYRYMIETPFETFPKFVIGTCDVNFENVRLESRCGLLSTAEAAWERITGSETHLKMAIAHRAAWKAIAYTAPKAAQTCRRFMRDHALKARGKVT